MFDILIATRSGLGKRETNEDNLASGTVGSLWYALLADGAGGHADGEEASRRVIGTLEAATLQTGADFVPARLTEAVVAAHQELQREQDGASGTRRMHSTAVALWIDTERNCALWSHVGDSRLYRVRHGLVDLVTVDDSVVQRMVEGGLLTAEQARTHPRKNQLIAALGIEDEVHPHTLAEPLAIEDGDAYLLCSDGWWEQFSDARIAELLMPAPTPADWLDAMQRCIEEADLPRQDNFSAVAVWVSDPAETTRFMDETVPSGLA
jgi:serine/threonine protein phosphatase PrpC